MHHGTHEVEELHQSLFRWSGLGVARLDRRQRTVEANNELLALLGSRANRVWRTRFTDLVHPGERGRLAAGLGDVVDGKRGGFAARFTLVCVDRAAVPAELTAMAIRGDNPQAATVFVVIRRLDAERSSARRASASPDTALSCVPARILEGVAAGKSTVQLAGELYMSRQGVDYHVAAMSRKLRVPNRAALVSRAYALGMFVPETWPPRVCSTFVK